MSMMDEWYQLYVNIVQVAVDFYPKWDTFRLINHFTNTKKLFLGMCMDSVDWTWFSYGAIAEALQVKPLLSGSCPTYS